MNGAAESPQAPGTETGSCFSFAVRSPMRFRFLRAGGGDPLDIRTSREDPSVPEGTHLLEWTTPEPEFVHARLYLHEDRFLLWFQSDGWYTVVPSTQTITAPEAEEPVRREQRIWGIPSLLMLGHRGDLPLHAASVEVDGSGLLFAAPGRHGKTTLAMAFHQAGHRILSEDAACLRQTLDPAVIPGPAMLRVRPDVMDGLRVSDIQVLGERDGRFVVAPAVDRRGDCRPVPLGGVVFLRQASNGLSIERVPPAAALPDLLSLTFRLPLPGTFRRIFPKLTALAARVPIWNVYRRLRLDDLPATVDGIVHVCLGHR